MSFYDLNVYSIHITPINKHLIEGTFKSSLANLHYQFTGLRNVIDPGLEIVTFFIDWKKSNKTLNAQTAFCGSIKSNIADPVISLNWALIEHSDKNKSEIFGRSVLYQKKQISITDDKDKRKYPFPLTYEKLQ